MAGSRLPFFSNPLLEPTDTNRDATQLDDNEFYELLPASCRGVEDKYKLVTPSQQVDEFLKDELDLTRLADIFERLWVVGRPMPPRPLHYQLLLSREPFLTERMDMHLVWTKGRIFLKPIPRFLLEPRFWARYLACRKPCSCSSFSIGNAVSTGGQREHLCERRKLWECALGFLFSYTALIANESDFAIAKDKNLVPHELKWPRWRIFVHEILSSKDIYANIDPRFFYGELRLSRLNKIYWFRKPYLKSYMSLWNQYGTFFEDNFALLATSTIYLAVVLTAMQVGLATNRLVDNDAFQAASYGFTVFSILGPLVVAAGVFVAFLFLFVNNFFATLRFSKKRFHTLQTSHRKS